MVAWAEDVCGFDAEVLAEVFGLGAEELAEEFDTGAPALFITKVCPMRIELLLKWFQLMSCFTVTWYLAAIFPRLSPLLTLYLTWLVVGEPPPEPDEREVCFELTSVWGLRSSSALWV